ncbi:LysR family transcriptional regulator [Pseudomonas sp. CHM02]|uniref:LysR family transcriptional regulator n=1 Tax=Pseudomonas sp. CHM02 TaxID=1463662 RepID=UPI0004709542|nr:LysR family transcriptional regulator [Pseudomonas sp. CHM02]
MDVIESMRIFVQVVDDSSFTRAAEALGIHKPCITKAIQNLERQLGTRILHRTTRKVGVTPEGEEFYRRCKSILDEVSDTMAFFSGDDKSIDGKLRIDLPITLAKYLIIPSLPEFNRLYPGIELIIGTSDQAVDIVAEGIDCVVRLGELPDSTLIARRIGAVPMVTCATPQYLEQYGSPESIEDLADHKAVNYFSGSNRKLMEWQFDVDGKTQSLRMRSAIMVNDTEAFVSCGLAGFGIMHGLRPTMQPYIDSGELVQLLPEVVSPRKSISIIYPDRRHLAPKVKAFADWLSSLINTQGYDCLSV